MSSQQDTAKEHEHAITGQGSADKPAVGAGSEKQLPGASQRKARPSQ